MLGGALLMLGAAAGLATMKGSDFALPLSMLLSGVLMILGYSLMMQGKNADSNATPTTSSTGGTSVLLEDEGIEDLPDPRDAGIDLPIL
ncbi:MAG: hypothetical protein NZ737_03945 [Candidatus Poseidoniaceae archaeon]|nr:hypothetical protein [Candidatus Poseidoniaceae archaeon]